MLAYSRSTLKLRHQVKVDTELSMDHQFNQANMRTPASHPTGLPPAGSGSIQQSPVSNNGAKMSKTEERLRIRCPFRAKNPRTYNIRDHGKCALHVYHNMAEVRQHVKKYHTHPDAPFYNPELVKNMLRDDGRRDRGIKTQWEVLWKLFFPDDPVQPYQHFELLPSIDSTFDSFRARLEQTLGVLGIQVPGAAETIFPYLRGYLRSVIRRVTVNAVDLTLENNSAEKDKNTHRKSPPSENNVAPPNPNASSDRHSTGTQAPSTFWNAAQRPSHGFQHRRRPKSVRGIYSTAWTGHSFPSVNQNAFNGCTWIGTQPPTQHPGTQQNLPHANTDIVNPQYPNGTIPPPPGAPHNFDPAYPNANPNFH